VIEKHILHITKDCFCFSNSLLYVVFAFAITHNQTAQIQKLADLLDFFSINEDRALPWDFSLEITLLKVFLIFTLY